MALTVTHAFTSLIADDPVAQAAGEILPSHWNAPLTVTGTMDIADVAGLQTALDAKAELVHSHWGQYLAIPLIMV